MKKLSAFLFFLAVFVFSLTTKAQAVIIESQSDKSSDLQTFVVLAEPGSVSTAIQLRLDVEGGIVKSFTAGDDGLLSIGVCDEEGTKFTSNRVCVDIANISGAFEYGDVLGALTVERSSNISQLTITKGEDNKYMAADGEFVQDSGRAFMLFGDAQLETNYDRETQSGLFFAVLFIVFLTGVVFGTTFTTLGHVLQAGKLYKKAKKD